MIFDTFPEPEAEFFSLMEKASAIFTPPLSESVELEAYSHKLYTHASFVICKHENRFIAFIAFYKNKEAKQLYVSLICVDNTFQRKGIGNKLLNKLSALKSYGFESIGLEVVKSNLQAYSFYKKYGFIEQEDRGEKLLMVKII